MFHCPEKKTNSLNCTAATESTAKYSTYNPTKMKKQADTNKQTELKLL